ncbi:MFS transporter [Pelagicoccus sp. SDUM812005]|uniref:MFS transporter n=1 Tax=Pelagicoccus sp. SDUM812005 TaxID=3041257 RepID=UPI00280E13DF|nr:MFS transporter [Pelagicoccus sp. SDUM812005]MDQ8181001.1 MFS transporter [Pelagicoccus sp. SDUM812005]
MKPENPDSPSADATSAPNGSHSEQAKPNAEYRTSLKEKLSYAIGTIPFMLGSSGVMQIANPLYNLTLGLSPSFVGTVMAIVRLWDGFTDPLMGSLSDNTRTRWGRRRPFIALGAVLCAITFPIMWLVPIDWGEAATFIYFLVTCLMFFTAFTVYGVPYLTLGYELSSDTSERLRIQTYRAMCTKIINFIAPWIFVIAQLDFFDSTISGFRAVGLIIGGLFILLAIPAVLNTRERFEKRAAQQQKVKLVKAVKLTLANRPFRCLVSIVVGMLIGTSMVNILGIYVNSYHVFPGDTEQGAKYHALAMTLYGVAGLVAVPIVSKIANRVGKLKVLQWCLLIGIVASASKFFSYTPHAPWLQFVTMLALSPAFSGFWVLIDPMKADTADYDELSTGMRREGMYAAVANWIEKVALTGTLLVSNSMLDITGFDVSKGADQGDGAILSIRLCYSLIPAALLTIAYIIARKYPLTDDGVIRLKGELEERRGKVV